MNREYAGASSAMNGVEKIEQKKFSSIEEELQYLRSVVADRERHLSSAPETIERHQERESIISEELAQYSMQDADRVLHERFKVSAKEQWEIILELSPETHDKKMEELMSLLQTKGILNAIQLARGLNNPHIDADFHRFLVEYLKKGYPAPGLKENAPVVKALRRTLYEVAMPESKIGAGKDASDRKGLKEIISSMEQFYAGMLSLGNSSSSEADSEENGENQLSIELAVSQGSEEFVFYVSVPDSKKELFEKQFLSIFPGAKVEQKKDDYNVFNADGFSVGSVATQSRREIFPIKTYEQFDYDPLNILLNALSKLQRDGEGASVQMVLNPAGEQYTKLYRKALGEIQKGESVDEATDIRHGIWDNFKKAVGDISKEAMKEISNNIKSSGSDGKDGKDKKDNDPKVVDNIAVEQITSKISSPVLEANLRIVASAENRARAEEILTNIEASFNQFDNTLGNAIKFERKDGNTLKDLLHNFAYRMFSKSDLMAVSVREITSFMHFPTESVVGVHELKQTKAGTAPVPLGLSKSGLYLGKNKHRNSETPVYITPEDRLRHYYTIGQTGTGKSTLLRNMIIQDIKNGDGVCFIDPHGSDVQDILAHIPKERYDDVIYFDPSYTDRPMALNMLEYNRDYPEQKTFVVNELFSIFQKLYGAVPESMGPMFEQYFRNATMLVIEDPESGCTLLDVSRVMAVKSFRDMKISKCKNPVVVQFWKDIAEKAGGEGSLQNMVPYITSKFDVFLANEIMRPIIAQEKSSFNFREIMDSKKILLVNLAKGRLGDINSSLIGLILVGKILMAALSRVDSFGKDMPPFYLYIDEFQNITTPSIATILSEARKYKLSLTIAHQFIAQLDDKIKDAVFGNVGNMSVFRVGAEDAEFLQKQFEPVFSANDIMNIDNMNCYIKMLSGGKPVRPFNVEFTWPPKGNEGVAESLKELSYLKYGQDRDLVESAIMEKYKKESVPTITPSSFPKIGA